MTENEGWEERLRKAANVAVAGMGADIKAHGHDIQHALARLAELKLACEIFTVASDLAQHAANALLAERDELAGKLEQVELTLEGALGVNRDQASRIEELERNVKGRTEECVNLKRDHAITLARYRERLGLPEDADEGAIYDAVGALQLRGAVPEGARYCSVPRDGQEYRVFMKVRSLVVAWEAGPNVWNNRTPFEQPGWDYEADWWANNCDAWVPADTKANDA